MALAPLSVGGFAAVGRLASWRWCNPLVAAMLLVIGLAPNSLLFLPGPQARYFILYTVGKL
jgi:hypothetical protein